MRSQSNLIRQGGNPSETRRQLDLTEEEIIRIPACDLTAASERFKRTLIGRVLHRRGRSVEAMIALLPRARIWNVEGRAREVNLGNGRFRFDFDKEEDLNMVLNKRPCHFNHWILALERWEPSTSENFGVPVHFWNDDISIDADKLLKLEARIEFPNGDFGKVYMKYEGLNRHCFGCKRISHDIYSCLDLGNVPNNKRPHSPNGDVSQRSPMRAGLPGQSRERRRIEGYERYPHHQGKSTVWNRLDDRYVETGGLQFSRGREPYRPRERHYSHQSQASQQTWRPQAQRNEGKSCSPSRTVTNPKYQRGLQVRNGPDGQGTGVLVVHKNETSEERLRRLKGKAIMDRGTVVIREGGIRSPPHAPRYVPPPLRLRDETEEPSLDLVNLMNSKHIDDMVLTREEEAEVDNLTDEFGDVDMDEDMVQNNDLLIDEPGYDAEIIDAISQLSLANAVNKENGATTAAEKEPQPTTMDQIKNKSASLSKIPHARKKKSYQSSELKGAQALKKLNALRGRPSPRKRGSGVRSAKCMMLSCVSGSVGSQKPPSKKI
ncbi:hypothetical protein Bca4012_090102 [Brassica carinata]|uniref:DUF4283 domain-containing protein n=1 Tax=Brassica carinata TaxID=52824 RepID=A0A8X7P6I0_BRACI|nr:hypothetical protein Bca52824_086562 [Brassica carinata]